jgi:hypothetical protein
MLESGDHAEGGGLAGAGCSQEGQEFASGDGQGKTVDGGEVPEALGELLKLENRLRRCLVPNGQLISPL